MDAMDTPYTNTHSMKYTGWTVRTSDGQKISYSTALIIGALTKHG